jgi:hypothetical protein
MNEFETNQKEVISILKDFLNRTQDGEQVVNEFTINIAEKFALTQEQRCAVKIALSYLDMIHHTLGEFPEGYTGITINLITRIVTKDWSGVEEMLKD